MSLELRTVRGKKIVWDITRGGALRMATDNDVQSIPEKPADPANEAIPQPNIPNVISTSTTVAPVVEPVKDTIKTLTNKFMQPGASDAANNSINTDKNTNP